MIRVQYLTLKWKINKLYFRKIKKKIKKNYGKTMLNSTTNK